MVHIANSIERKWLVLCADDSIAASDVGIDWNVY